MGTHMYTYIHVYTRIYAAYWKEIYRRKKKRYAYGIRDMHMGTHIYTYIHVYTRIYAAYWKEIYRKKEICIWDSRHAYGTWRLSKRSMYVKSPAYVNRGLLMWKETYRKKNYRKSETCIWDTRRINRTYACQKPYICEFLTCIVKETCFREESACEKRPIKETCICENRHKRGLQVWKETFFGGSSWRQGSEESTCEKRPIKETYICEKRPIHETYTWKETY